MASRIKQQQLKQRFTEEGVAFAPALLAEELELLQGAGAQRTESGLMHSPRDACACGAVQGRCNS
jgi:hypothetical protein